MMDRFPAWRVVAALAAVPANAKTQTVIDFDAVGFDIDNVPQVTFTGAQLVNHGGITGLSGTQGFGRTNFNNPIRLHSKPH